MQILTDPSAWGDRVTKSSSVPEQLDIIPRTDLSYVVCVIRIASNLDLGTHTKLELTYITRGKYTKAAGYFSVKSL